MSDRGTIRYQKLSPGDSVDIDKIYWNGWPSDGVQDPPDLLGGDPERHTETVYYNKPYPLVKTLWYIGSQKYAVTLGILMHDNVLHVTVYRTDMYLRNAGPKFQELGP